MKLMRKADALIAAGADASVVGAVSSCYAVGVSDHGMAAMRSVDPGEDPVARQYIPSAQELEDRDYECADPTGDDAHSPVPGVVHRYCDRVLLKVTSVCPVYCRYCFRKTRVGPGGEGMNAPALEAALSYIAARPEIWEVILTGGDPLMLSPDKLGRLLQRLSAIAHVQVIRVHSRVPSADPARIESAMLDVLSCFDTPVHLVIHINHAQEMGDPVVRALRDLRKRGVLLLSQSVLLRGVNDNAEALESLFRALVVQGVRPYMLHHLDPAPGTSHFRVSIAEGQAVMRALRGRVSGLCLPEYMLDIPGGFGKIPLTPSYCDGGFGGEYRLTDYQGGVHVYRDQG